MVHEILTGVRADHETRRPNPQAVLVHLRRVYMVVKTAPIVPGNENGEM